MVRDGVPGGLPLVELEAVRVMAAAREALHAAAWDLCADSVTGRVVDVDADGRFKLRLNDVPPGVTVDVPGWMTLETGGGRGDVMAYVAALESVTSVGGGVLEVGGALVVDDGPRPPGPGPLAKAARVHRRFLGLMRGRRLTRWSVLGGELRPVHDGLRVDSVGVGG